MGPVGHRGNAAVLDAQLGLLAQTLHATRFGRLMGRDWWQPCFGSRIVSTFIVLNVRNWKGLDFKWMIFYDIDIVCLCFFSGSCRGWTCRNRWGWNTQSLQRRTRCVTIIQADRLFIHQLVWCCLFECLIQRVLFPSPSDVSFAEKKKYEGYLLCFIFLGWSGWYTINLSLTKGTKNQNKQGRGSGYQWIN